MKLISMREVSRGGVVAAQLAGLTTITRERRSLSEKGVKSRSKSDSRGWRLLIEAPKPSQGDEGSSPGCDGSSACEIGIPTEPTPLQLSGQPQAGSASDRHSDHPQQQTLTNTT